MRGDDEIDPPLSRWTPPRKVIAFPLTMRVGKIRHVATKMLDKHTEKHALWYKNQVSESLVAHLSELGVDPYEQNRQLTEFWVMVQIEMDRRQYLSGGAA